MFLAVAFVDAGRGCVISSRSLAGDAVANSALRERAVRPVAWQHGDRSRPARYDDGFAMIPSAIFAAMLVVGMAALEAGWGFAAMCGTRLIEEAGHAVDTIWMGLRPASVLRADAAQWAGGGQV